MTPKITVVPVIKRFTHRNVSKHIYYFFILYDCKFETKRSFVVDHPNFYCHICKHKYGIKQYYLKHLPKVHKVENTDYLSHPNISPNLLNPNFYCRKFKSAENSLMKHSEHCRRAHNLILDRIPR